MSTELLSDLDRLMWTQSREGAMTWGIDCAQFIREHGPALRSAMEDAEKWRAWDEACKTLTWPPSDDTASDAYESQRAELACAADLLARIHGDGGHYQNKHGTRKACADAETVVLSLRAELEAMRACEVEYIRADLHAALERRCVGLGQTVEMRDTAALANRLTIERLQAQVTKLRDEALAWRIFCHQSTAKQRWICSCAEENGNLMDEVLEQGENLGAIMEEFDAALAQRGKGG